MSTPETRRRSAGDPGALFPSPLVNRIRLLAVYLVTCLASDAGAESPLTTTLGFNDLGNSTGGSHMPDRYDGFRWQTTNWHYMSLPGTPGETFLALSGNSTSIASNTSADFHFDGVDCWSRRGADATGSFYYYLTHNGVVVYDGREDNDGRHRFNGTRQHFTPNYSGPVDVVAIVFTQGGDDWDHLAMDNFQFHGLQSAQIPSAPGILMQPDRVNLEFQGTPGEPYRIDASASPAPGMWSQIGVVTADGSGAIHFSDIGPTLSSRFYRCVSP